MCVIKLEAVYGTQCNLNDIQCVYVYELRAAIYSLHFFSTSFTSHSHSFFLPLFFLSFTLYFCHWHGDSSRVDELLKLLMLRLSRNKCISYKVYYAMCIAVFSLSLSLSIDSIHLPHVCPPHKFYFVVSTKSHRYLCPCTIRCMCMCIPSVSTLYPFISSHIHSICLSVCHQHS